MNKHSNPIKTWLPLAVVGSALVLLIGVSTQQVLRRSADDPQIQIAEDIAAAIEAGAGPQSVVPSKKVDIGKSLAPIILVADANGTIVSSSATLQGSTPTLPKGTLEFAKQHGQNRFTWQPADGVRLATVAVYYGGNNPGYVVVGRSLREVEKREDAARNVAALDWMGMLVASFLLVKFTS
jgi:hypothetical protein